MSHTATCIKVKDAQQRGDYNNTEVDLQKEQAEVRLTQVGPFVAVSKLELKGRGIKKIATDTFQLTEAAWAKVQTQYNWVTDF